MAAAEKPDYVKEFLKDKPRNTEVKHINGHYYLYEVHSVYDQALKRSRKISDKILGSITPNGFILSKKRRTSESDTAGDEADEKKGPGLETDPESACCCDSEKAGCFQNPQPAGDNAAGIASQQTDQVLEPPKDIMWPPDFHPPGAEYDACLREKYSDVVMGTPFEEARAAVIPLERLLPEVEAGASLYMYSRTKEVRERLKQFFGDSWRYLYVAGMLWAMYGPPLDSVHVGYMDGVLSHMFPGLDFYEKNLLRQLRETGAEGERIAAYLKAEQNSTALSLQAAEERFGNRIEWKRAKLACRTDRCTWEGWLFLNHLASEMAANAALELSTLDKTEKLSYAEAIDILGTIEAQRSAEHRWSVPEAGKQARDLCAALGLDLLKEMETFPWDQRGKA